MDPRLAAPLIPTPHGETRAGDDGISAGDGTVHANEPSSGAGGFFMSRLASPLLPSKTTLANIGEDKILCIARVVHGATRVYDQFSGDMWKPSWEEASDRDRAEVIAGVKAVVSGNANSPEELHAVRVRFQLGTALPFEALSLEQRRTTELFRALVIALVDGPCDGDCHDPCCSVVAPHPCHLNTCLSEFGIPLNAIGSIP